MPIFVSRWSPSAGWSTEHVTSGAFSVDAKIGIAGEDVYVGFLTGGPLLQGIGYARRGATGWTIHEVTSDNVGQFAMAVEPCGALHFVGWTSVLAAIRYYRSTESGWRFTDLADPS